MKKILSVLSLALVALAFVSCSKNSPEGVVEEYYSRIQKGQYEEAIDLLYFKNDLSDKDKERIATMIREKGGKENDKKGGISSVVIDNVDLAEDGNSAIVNYTIKYGDGSAKSEKNKVLKVDGNWMLDSGK